MKKKTIAVAMSGGVDSSVAAYLLQQEGWDVVGVFMRNWVESGESARGCTAEDDMADVRRVCAILCIPFYTFSFVDEYYQRVFAVCLDALQAGFTPNPDMLCNAEIKFQLFLNKALQLPGVHTVATGHYCALKKQRLVRPRDRAKDQTYFLARIAPHALQHVLFPLARYTKQEVRAIARQCGFPNARKKDSTGLCFVGERKWTPFLAQYLPDKPGNIIDDNGNIIGTHHGLYFLTIGQRHGLNIGGRGPYYVVRKSVATNTVHVTNNPQDSALYARTCTLSRMQWFPHNMTEQMENLHIQVRYRQQPQRATIEADDRHGALTVQFAQPVRAVTPGQVGVLYQDDAVVGAGMIASAT